MGIQPQGIRIQRRAVARVIRVYARQKGHLRGRHKDTGNM